MNKHTPGPWILNEHPYRDQPEYVLTAKRYHQDYGHLEVATVLHNSITNIACVAVVARAQQLGQAGLPTNEEAKANARLIAASPELLAALKLMLSANELQGGATDAELEQARSAIVKATGGLYE